MKLNKIFVGFLILVMLFSAVAVFAIELSAAGKQKLNPWLKILLGESKAQIVDLASKKGSLVRGTLRNGEPAFGVCIRSTATRQELEKLGAEVKTSTPGVCTAVVPLATSVIFYCLFF